MVLIIWLRRTRDGFSNLKTQNLFTWTRTTAQHQDCLGNFPLMSLPAGLNSTRTEQDENGRQLHIRLKIFKYHNVETRMIFLLLKMKEKCRCCSVLSCFISTPTNSLFFSPLYKLQRGNLFGRAADEHPIKRLAWEETVFTLLFSLTHASSTPASNIRSGSNNMWFYSGRLDEGAPGAGIIIRLGGSLLALPTSSPEHRALV